LINSQCSNHHQATLAIINATCWTGNSHQPLAEAIAIKGNRFVAVGTKAQIEKWITPQTVLIDAQGGFVTPGFFDAHLHFLEGGSRLTEVQLRDARTPEEFIQRIKTYATNCLPGKWITGGDWDHSLWGGQLPQRSWIDSVTPHNPVWINRLDGHMALANSLALQLAGIDKHTPDVPGGTIVRDAAGDPTGILKDNAMFLVEKVVPPSDDSARLAALEAAMDYVASQGVTSVQHMGSWEDLKIFIQAYELKKLKTRISAAVPLATYQELAKRKSDYRRYEPWLKVTSVKGFVDGSLGSHTAAFLANYTDTPTDSGLLVNTADDLYQLISGADKAGLQVCMHAIGDRANRILLDIYARVIQENGPRDRRFRIEHAQHLDPQDIPRFAQLGVITSMQPYHCIDDGRWAEKFIGHERCRTTYAFRSLLAAGAHLAFGSDWYVAPPSPLWGIYAAVTRRTLDNKNPAGWIPEQKISVAEALQAYTLGAAYASFDEKIKGSLEVGKLADLVILNQNLFAIDPTQIPEVKVLMTICDGKIIYDKMTSSSDNLAIR
jgi:predicted amidohydrolase YtcJ